MTYTLCFQGKPITEPNKDWKLVADFALSRGFAVRALGVIFTLCPGVSIRHA